MDDQSAQPCGCDLGAGYVCRRHQEEASFMSRNTVPATGPFVKAVYDEMARLPDWDDLSKYLDGCGEVRTVDPTTGGEKGAKTARFSLIPSEFLWALATHYGVGARKYEDRNWERGYKWSLSLDALQRHLHQWLLGEDNDMETNTNHLIAVAWHACALFVFQMRRLGTDDVRRHQ